MTATPPLTAQAEAERIVDRVVAEFGAIDFRSVAALLKERIASALSASPAAAVAEAYEDAAQRCRYYLKHQNFERDLDTGKQSDFADGTEIACSNLSDIFEEKAAAIRSRPPANGGKYKAT